MDTDINSTAWWDDYFRNQWEKNLGGEQTEYFMNLILNKLPVCLKKILSKDKIKILDWGCALGQGVDVLSKNFPRAKVYGLDASLVAIEKAKDLYPKYNFSTSLLEEQNEKYDVIISSNCLEYFSNPQAVMQEHLKYTNLLYIILVPFNELNRIESHLVTFDIDSFLDKANNFRKIYSNIINVDNSNFWKGSQILVVYAHKDLDLFALYLQNLAPDALSSDLILDSDLDSQTPALWDNVSESYKDDPSDVELALGDEIEALLLKMGVSPGASLLEVGCGSGHLSGILAKKGYNTTLLDFSEAALEKAKKYYEKHGLKGNFILCDMMNLSPDLVGHYDVVWNSGVLEHFDSWQVVAVMKKMGNIAKELAIVLVPNARSKPYLLFRRAAIRAGEWQWGRELLRDTMIHLAEAAGLNVIEETYLGEIFTQDHLEYYKSKLNASNIGVNDGLIFYPELMPEDQRYLIALIAKGQVESDFNSEAKVFEIMTKNEGEVNRKTYLFDTAELNNVINLKNQYISRLENENGTLLELKTALESNLNNADIKLQILQETINLRESSISWKFSQWYGKYFEADSRITKILYYLFNKVIVQSNSRSKSKPIIAEKKYESKQECFPVTQPIEENNVANDIYFGEIKDKVSIILPVFNQASLLNESIKSILSQTYKDFELIIINDGSYDDIETVLNKYVDHPKILILTQGNQKLPKALSNGFKFARGEFYTWTSADNIMLPTMLEEQVRFLKGHPGVDMVFCDYEAIDEIGKPLVNSDFRVHNQNPTGSSFIHLPRSTENLNTEKDNFIGPCFMYRGLIGKAIGDYDPYAFGCEDYDYWMRINSLFKIDHIGTDKILYRYRVHEATISAKAKEFGIFEKVERLMKYDCERLSFYEDRFDIISIKWPNFCNIEGFFREINNNVTNANDLKMIKNNRFNKKCLVFTADLKIAGNYQELDGSDIFKVTVIDKVIDEFDIDSNAFKLCDWIITSKMESFDLLFNKYKDRILYIPEYNKRFSDLILKISNNKLFYRLTRPEEKQVSTKVYLNRKLNLLIETSALDKGGLEQVIFDIAAKLDKSIFNIYIACIEKDGMIADRCREAGAKVFVINKNQEKYEKLIQKLEIDLINAHYSLFGIKAASKFGIPVVAVLHNNYVWLSDSEISEFKEADKYIQKYIAVSKNVSKYSRNYFGISPRKIEVIPNGIDIELLQSEKMNGISKSRTDFGLGEEDFIFLNVAAYASAKSHNLMIAAMDELVDQYPSIKIVCVGHTLDNIYYRKIKQEAENRNLIKNIIFTGYISDENLKALYQMADAFLLPSLFEGWSVSAMEAMSYGLPMILTDVGSSREIIENEDIGIIIPNSYGDVINLNISNLQKFISEKRPLNTDQLKAAMIEFYKNRNKWKKAGKMGIDKVKRLYDLSNAINQYQNIFLDIRKGCELEIKK